MRRAREAADGDEGRLLAADIEGTLTDRAGRRTSRGLLWRLRALERAGVTVAFCSGRGAGYQRALRRKWGLDPTAPGVAENGAAVLFGDGEHLTYERDSFDREGLVSVLLSAGAEELGELDPGKEHEITLYPKGFMEGREYSAGDIERIFCFLKRTLRGRQCRIFYTSASGEVLPRGVDKGAGLALLLRLSGTRRRQVTLLCDGHNDLPAARLVARGGGLVGIPANAVSELRDLATASSRRECHDGSAELLDRFFPAVLRK